MLGALCGGEALAALSPARPTSGSDQAASGKIWADLFRLSLIRRSCDDSSVCAHPRCIRVSCPLRLCNAREQAPELSAGRAWSRFMSEQLAEAMTLARTLWHGGKPKESAEALKSISTSDAPAQVRRLQHPAASNSGYILVANLASSVLPCRRSTISF